MQFTATDLDTMLEVTGQPVTIKLSGVTVKVIQGKFRKNFESVSSYESTSGILLPVVLCKTSDLEGITSSHVFEIDGKEYKFDGKPEEQPSGLTKVPLGVRV